MPAKWLSESFVVCLSEALSGFSGTDSGESPAVLPPKDEKPPAGHQAPPGREVRGRLIVEDSTSEDTGGFLDLASELRTELSEEFDHDVEPTSQADPVTFEEIFAQFKK